MVSSPASTGGAGTVFEQHVGACWLSLLLVRAIPPIINDCTLAEIRFQTEYLGFRTDDFLVVGETSAGVRRKLVGQVKRSFTVSASDDECRKAFHDFWGDFSRSVEFDRANDRLVLVTMRGTNTLLEHFAALLDCARASRDARDFARRLETPGFVHAKVVDYFGVIRAIIDEAGGPNVAPEDVWRFLRTLHVLSLDLTTSSGQTEALIKTLLAHTATTRDPLGAAGATWVALVAEAGEAASHAKGYAWETLPLDLRERHGPIATGDLRFLRALVDHSTPILKGIRGVLGPGVHLTRERLIQAALACANEVQIVFLTGPAGSGKSVIARDVLAVLEADHFCFGFRAEEFATAHLDTTLQHAQMPAGAIMLRAILAGQPRKVALVESVERLLEASTRDAFSDLLKLACEDRGWILLLTCRDYSLDLIRSSFLERAGMPHLAVSVPPLDDSELGEVEAACPAIRRPLSNPSLRRLMRNPYVLDMALRMPWPEERPLPGDEQEFRVRFWREVVRADHRMGGGMPRRREVAFVEVAVRRARALAVYAGCGDLDAEALEGLRADSLISCPPDSTSLAAPAHDVLEDWAIFEWIGDQKDLHGDAVAGFSEALGTYPAIRRTYRRWAQELVDREPDSADELFRSVLEGCCNLAAHFRDDTLIAILQSPSASDFLSRHEGALLGCDKELLRRIVHLLRVGCLKVPDRADASPRLASALAVPDGSAWPCVLRLIRDNLGRFSEADASLLLGLIEDWARGVSRQTPYPDGYEAAAAIAHHLLEYYDLYRSRDRRKSVLRIIAIIPEGDPDRFDGLLRGHRPGGVGDHASDDLRKIVLTGLESLPACRDMPTLVVSVAREHILLDEAALRDGRRCGRLWEVELAFGIQERCHHEFDPPSAWRGSFYSLLCCHPRIGLDFILELVNTSTTWYGEGRYRSRYVEPPARIMLTFPDGTTVEQWCSPRLWDLYRGVAPALGVLQCALMALEAWLFEYAEAYGVGLDQVLARILKEGRSVASTSVVASLVTAFPHLSCEALLTLLSSPECIYLDRGRMLGEYSLRFKRSGAWLTEDRICESERRAADERPHRRRDLEAAVLTAQLGPLATRVQRALDAHREKVPPIGDQRDTDRIWRLALHRMDLRRYGAIVETRTEGEVQNQAGEPARRILFEPTSPEADLQEMLDREGGQRQRAKKRLTTWTWAISVFRNTDTDPSDPSLWREKLGEARDAVVEDGGAPRDGARYGGPAVVAAVCVRDHWEEMALDERAWCASEICAAIEEGCDDWIQNNRAERMSMAHDRPAAWAASELVGKALPDGLGQRVSRAFILALTHANDEVRNFASAGVGVHLWERDPALALRCVNLLAFEANILGSAIGEQERRSHEERRDISEIESEAAASVRREFFHPGSIPNDAYLSLDLSGWVGSQAGCNVLSILVHAPEEHLALRLFDRLAKVFVRWWDLDDDREARHARPTAAESTLADVYRRFVCRICPGEVASLLGPVLAAVDRHPQDVASMVEGFISLEDRRSDPARFWMIWGLFAERVLAATRLADIDEKPARGEGLTSAMFLGTGWGKGVGHWRSLDGYAHLVHSLFERLPASAAILEDYVVFLYCIGDKSLPESFVRLARRLDGPGARWLLRRNTIDVLEALLRRFVYGRPRELKPRPDLRNAVLVILDALVEGGSSAAFRMRDDFVTPDPEGDSRRRPMPTGEGPRTATDPGDRTRPRDSSAENRG